MFFHLLSQGGKFENDSDHESPSSFFSFLFIEEIPSFRLIGQDRFRMRKKYQKPMNKNKCWGKGMKKKWKEHESEKKVNFVQKAGSS